MRHATLRLILLLALAAPAAAQTEGPVSAMPPIRVLEALGLELPGDGWVLGVGLAQRSYGSRWDLGDLGVNRRSFSQLEALAFLERPAILDVSRADVRVRAEVHGGRGDGTTEALFGTLVLSDGALSLGASAGIHTVWGTHESGRLILGVGLDHTWIMASGDGGFTAGNDWFASPWTERVTSLPLELGAWIPVGRWFLVLQSVVGPAVFSTDWTAGGHDPGHGYGTIRWATLALAWVL